MTVKGNLEFGRELLTRDFEQEQKLRAERFQDLVRLFRIGDLLERYPAQLSGGQAQRVSVARALMPRHSRLVLLDEPFTGLEQALRDELLLTLKQWTREHRLPVLSVTHDVTEALLLEAEVIKLHEGRIVAQGPAQEVLAGERLQLLRSLDGSQTFTL
jgi:molybdate transport system ATP-binding protein